MPAIRLVHISDLSCPICDEVVAKSGTWSNVRLRGAIVLWPDNITTQQNKMWFAIPCKKGHKVAVKYPEMVGAKWIFEEFDAAQCGPEAEFARFPGDTTDGWRLWITVW